MSNGQFYKGNLVIGKIKKNYLQVRVWVVHNRKVLYNGN